MLQTEDHVVENATRLRTPSFQRSGEKVQPDTSDVHKEDGTVPRLEGRPGHASVL